MRLCSYNAGRSSLNACSGDFFFYDFIALSQRTKYESQTNVNKILPHFLSLCLSPFFPCAIHLSVSFLLFRAVFLYFVVVCIISEFYRELQHKICIT